MHFRRKNFSDKILQKDENIKKKFEANKTKAPFQFGTGIAASKDRMGKWKKVAGKFNGPMNDFQPKSRGFEAVDIIFELDIASQTLGWRDLFLI